MSLAEFKMIWNECWMINENSRGHRVEGGSCGNEGGIFSIRKKTKRILIYNMRQTTHMNKIPQ